MMDAKEVNTKFQENLAKILEDRSFTYGMLADKLGVPRQYVKNYIDKKKMPNTYMAVRIAKALGMSVNDIIEGKMGENKGLKEVNKPDEKIFAFALQTNMNKAIKKQKLIQDQLSQKTGLEQGSISNILTGKRIPKLAPVYLIGKALDMEVSDFVDMF